MRISEDFARMVKDQADIVRIIGAFVDLKKQGSSYKGCCPFHNEKSPSFTVHPVRRSFKCFGCGAGGDVVKFLMEHKKLTYPEAITYLAEDLNLAVEYDTPSRPKSRFFGLKLR